MEASDSADILFCCVYLFMLISLADDLAEAPTANILAVGASETVFLKRITMKRTNSGTDAGFPFKYMI